MLDALLPAAEAFHEAIHAGRSMRDYLRAAAAAAAAGARATSDMMPKRGRSSYLGVRALGHPDPGAEAVAVWLGAMSTQQENG
jgi:dihydroxyacetone kinase